MIRVLLGPFRAALAALRQPPAGVLPEGPATVKPYCGPDDRSQSETLRRIRPLVEAANKRARRGRL